MDSKVLSSERQSRVVKNGKLEIKRTTELKGVTREMLAWYGPNRTTEMYKMWHPDHIDIKVLYKPEKGRAGQIQLERQRLGKHVYTMKLTMGESKGNVSDSWLKFPLFTIHNHSVTEETPTSVIRHSTNTYGSDNPIWGWLWNFYLRKFVLPSFLKDFFKHQDEEAENYSQFLPKLYAEHTGKMDQAKD